MTQNNRNDILRKLLISSLLLIFTHNLYATDKYEQYRAYYFVSKSIKPNWTYIGALGIHYIPKKDDWNRTEIRNEISYRFRRDIKFSVGARINYVGRYGEKYQFELRPYQAVSLTWPRFNSFKFTNRFLMEERITWDLTGDNETIVQGRFRYRLDTKIPINKPALIPKTIYIRPMIETFLSFGENIDNAYISQNKYTIAPGYIISKKLTLEFRYEFLTGNSLNDHTLQSTTNLFRIQLTQKLF
ncbi:DUF2490 domain-containing protein [Halosquirtibacter laminarini]|uniref:DUF2490 domain-containing protein n=1 Tax=Halosquirtibacter laminarini TaxID=3374600 RepID=A0AC61NNK5_9BACT|nr:DUF2490 domain-containing protein [Prolixibacteraceae bacterium]